MSEKANYNDPRFIDEMSKCKAFYIKSPKGGHYNDGYELLCFFQRTNKQDYFNLLNKLEIIYTLHTQKPDEWTPPPIEEHDGTLWMTYESQQNCFGFHTNVQLGPSEYSILFNFNQKSHYDVFLDDVINALAFEQVLLTKGLLQ